jgi:hypothetical protein
MYNDFIKEYKENRKLEDVSIFLIFLNKIIIHWLFSQISLFRPLASTFRHQTNTFLKHQSSLYITRPVASVPPEFFFGYEGVG